MNRLAHVCAEIHRRPLMVQDSKLVAIRRVVAAKLAGEDVDLPDFERRVYEPQRVGSVAVLPLMGILARRMNLMMEYSGGTSTEMFGQWLDDAVDDDSVGTIFLICCGPGGTVHGTPELARRVFQARSKKRIVAIADGEVASATFYVYAGAAERYVVPSGELGWVGVIMSHVDFSRALANNGIEETFITSTPYKAEGNDSEPLSAETLAYWQGQVDELGAMFENDLAEFYGITRAEVQARFGQGRGLVATEALAAGMCERIVTVEDLMAELTAEDQPPLQEDLPDPPIRSAPPAGAMETRTFGGGEVRAADEEGREMLHGTAVRFGSISRELRTPSGAVFLEEIAEGAFAASLASDDVRVQWQHDPRYVFGRVSAGTARVWEEPGDGLRYTASPPDAQWARDAMASIRRGDVTQNSFSFRVLPGGDRFERREGKLYRVVTRAQLFEVGPQTQPAYPDTTVAVRAAESFLASERRVAARAHATARRRKLDLAAKAVRG
ncbi:MAG TPA: HK97 family phage prohead protease [Longimicrobium sp.]|nr:HK97 family phage prohead protease [Longimicrobium sp.]